MAHHGDLACLWRGISNKCIQALLLALQRCTLLCLSIDVSAVSFLALPRARFATNAAGLDITTYYVCCFIFVVLHGGSGVRSGRSLFVVPAVQRHNNSDCDYFFIPPAQTSVTVIRVSLKAAKA